MSLLSYFKDRLGITDSTRLTPTWSYETDSASHLIWRLLISREAVLTSEVREVDKKEGTLLAIELATGELLWKDVRLEEAWWFNSEVASSDTLYIQTFRRPDLPEPLGIIALDLRTGTQRWHQPAYAFRFEHNGSVYAYHEQYGVRHYAILDAQTGTLLESLRTDTAKVEEARRSADLPDLHSHYATSIGEHHPLFAQVSELLSSTLETSSLRGEIDYLEFERYLVLSYHARSTKGGTAMLNNLLTSELIVLDKETGDLLFHETLHTETPLPLPDNFFVSHRTLIYVKEKRVLTGIRLP